jgi:hypothetical protein
VHVDPHVDDPSALGAAMLAACAVGASIVRSGSRTIITPDPGAAEWWSDASGRHDALRRTLGGLTARQQPESVS